MQAKPNKVKFSKQDKPLTDAQRKYLEQRKAQRRSEIEKRQRRKAFDTWTMYIREGGREV